MNRYDVIVVGARCAGAPTAMLLARRGYRVLVVDRARFPSDTPSTHIVQPPGVAALRRWGVLDRVLATGAPPFRRYSLDFGPFTIAGTPKSQDGATLTCAPRRTVLDHILVQAAAEAGAEVREEFTVDELLTDDGAVVGIRGHAAGGTSVVERAAVVVGADGWNSRVARAVGAQPYKAKPVLQWGCYTYWSNLPVDGFEVVIRPGVAIGAVPTNDGLTLVVAGRPIADAKAYRADVEGGYHDILALAPDFAARVGAATREERFVGGGTPNFFRRPFGPGWALVGDAGYTKDPVTAQGMSDAFYDAERCSAALDEAFTGARPFAEAMAAYQQERDERAGALYDFTTQMATFEPPPPEMQQLLAAISGNADAMDGFISVIAGTLSPPEFFNPANLERILGAAEPAASV